MLAADLFESNRHIAEACRDHPFVQGIATGALPRASFCFYVAQDASFLDAFVRAYALGLARSPDAEATASFKALLDGAVEELDLHHRYAARWGVALGAAAAPATRAYADFLLRVAALEPVGHLCAAMAPCMRLYAWLARELVPIASSSSDYREWVDTYSDPAFEELARTLEAMLDRLGGDADTIASHYTTAMELELGFFAAAHAAR